MKQGFKFEKLLIWQQAMDLGEILNELSLGFPDRERFNLSSQMMRAVDSVALNISEGSIEQSGPEYRKFVGYSVRSLAEVVTCMHKAHRRKYLATDKFEEHYNFAFNLMNMMVVFKKKIK